MCTQIPKMIKWNSWKSGLVSRICTEHGVALHSVCACVCTPVLPSWQVATLSLLRVASLLLARGAGCGWLQLAWPASLTVISGGRSHVAAAKTKIPGPLMGMGEEAHEQTGSLCGPHRGCMLPQGLPGHCARADREATDTSPGQVPVQAPQAGVAGLLSARAPGCSGSRGREHWCLSTAVISVWLWCPLLCWSLFICCLCPPGCLHSSVLSGFRGHLHMGLRHQPGKQVSCLLLGSPLQTASCGIGTGSSFTGPFGIL